MILDTNALSAWAEQDAALLDVLPEVRLLILPVIALGEYWYGVLRSRHRATLELWLQRTIATIRVAPITTATSQSYAHLRNLLHTKGTSIPANDMWIAALALQHRLPVLSRDTHFDAVDGLTRIGW